MGPETTSTRNEPEARATRPRTGGSAAYLLTNFPLGSLVRHSGHADRGGCRTAIVRDRLPVAAFADVIAQLIRAVLTYLERT